MNRRCFISHASEDKELFVRPLAHALKRIGVDVWYDEFSLRPGDSLRRSIDKGLIECDAGLVVLSHSFFAKEWPQRELDALLGAEIAGTKKLYPIWHGVDAAYVRSVSPLLADKIAISASGGVDRVASTFSELFELKPGVSGDILASKLELFLSHETYIGEFVGSGCRHRFYQLQGFFTAYQALVDAQTKPLSDNELEEKIDGIIETLEPARSKLARAFDLPEDVEIVPDDPLPESRLEAWLHGFDGWAAGTLSESEVEELLYDVETYFEVDYLYIFLGLGNYIASDDQRELLANGIRAVGSWLVNDTPNELENICAQLRKLDEVASLPEGS